MSEIRMSRVPTIVRGAQRQVLFPALLLASSSALLLSGCGAAFNLGKGASPSGAVLEAADHGTVHGGQSAVTGATVSYYAIGATSTTANGYYASLGSPLVTTTSGADGTWSVPAYTCTTGDELYVVATGGNQIGNTTPNSALALVTVVGQCGSQFPHSNINIDEVTTVATAFALNGFAQDYLHIGTTKTNLVGLTNAVAQVPNLVDISQGTANSIIPYYANNVPAGSTPESFGGIAPNDAINTLADILSNCVNAAGGASDPACTALFLYTGGTSSDPVGHDGVRGPVAATTADAAYYIAHNPGLPGTSGPGNSNNITNLFNLFVSTGAPFTPALGGAPNDWTLTVNYVSGGVGGTSTTQAPQVINLAIDGQGNVWAQSTRVHQVAGMSNVGVPLTPTSTTSALGGIIAPNSGTPKRIAVDATNNLWIVDGINCLDELPSGGSSLSVFTGACSSGQAANDNGVAVDTNGHIWVSGSNFADGATNAGSQLFSVSLPSSTLTAFSGQDYAGNMWFLDQGDDSMLAFSLTGAASLTGANGFLGNAPLNYAGFGTEPASKICSTPPCSNNGFSLYLPFAGAAPQVQDIWVTGPPTAPSISNPNGGLGISNPTPLSLFGFSIDGLNQFYVNNSTGATETTSWVQVYNANDLQLSPSPVVSPTTGNGYRGATGQSALYRPQAMAVDQSGNLWVVNQYNWNAQQKAGPYSTTYATNGAGQSNYTVFIGLANPVNPVAVQNVVNQTYGKMP